MIKVLCVKKTNDVFRLLEYDREENLALVVEGVVSDPFRYEQKKVYTKPIRVKVDPKHLALGEADAQTLKSQELDRGFEYKLCREAHFALCSPPLLSNFIVNGISSYQQSKSKLMSLFREGPDEFVKFLRQWNRERPEEVKKFLATR